MNVQPKTLDELWAELRVQHAELVQLERQKVDVQMAEQEYRDELRRRIQEAYEAHDEARRRFDHTLEQIERLTAEQAS